MWKNHTTYGSKGTGKYNIQYLQSRWSSYGRPKCKLFIQYGLLKFIEDCYGIFRTEWDETVFDENKVMLDYKRADVWTEVVMVRYTDQLLCEEHIKNAQGRDTTCKR